jgi:hypothetical protein
VKSSPGGRDPAVDAVLLPPGEDFTVDALAFASYSDAGQTPGFAGSVLATGVVDDVSVWSAEPAGPALALTAAGAARRVRWNAWPGWTYRLERSADLAAWSMVGTVTPAQPGPVSLDDGPPPADAAFYRLTATPAP